MDAEELHHYQGLLQLHQQQLRRLEVKAARFGALHVPNHIQLELESELAAIMRIQAILNPQPTEDPTNVRLVDERYYPELLRRYEIAIFQVITPTTFVLACNYCARTGKRPHTVAAWKVTQWYEQACHVCKGKGVIKVQVEDYLIPDARCEASGKARPNAKTRDVKRCGSCNGLGVRSVTGVATVLE